MAGPPPPSNQDVTHVIADKHASKPVPSAANAEQPLDLSATLSHFERLCRTIVESETRDPVTPPIPSEHLLERMDLGLPTEGLGADALARKLADVVAVTPKTATPQFFNQLFGGRDWAAVLGDLLVPVLNNSMYTYKVAGVHVLIERILVEKMGRLMGYDQPGGVFSPGGSLSNMTAMALARNQAEEGAREAGLGGATHRIYTSAASHYSIRKSAGMLGIGRDNVVKVAVDARARMRPDALQAAIEADLANGYLPTMVNATLGTTVAGAYDPIRPLVELCQQHGIWLHLDGAWGASLVLCPEYAHLFDGAELADSITWDAHKMMGVPLTSSVLLTRSQEALTSCLSEQADYLFQQDSDWLNPGTRSLQCGRRNDFLKVWTAWQAHGDDGYADRVRHLRDLTTHAVNTIEQDPGLALVLQPESLNVCFTVEGNTAPEICQRLHAQGRILVGFGDVHGQNVVRVIFVNPDLDRADVSRFFEHVRAVAD